MGKTYETPGQLESRYRRMTKVAAWAAGLSLLGVPAAEAAQSHTTLSSKEAAALSEQSPQSLISTIDNQLVPLVGRLKSLKEAKVYNGTTVKASPDVNFYFLSAPNEAKPHMYNLLEVAVKSGQETPLFAAVSIGANSDKWKGTTNTPDGMILNQTSGPQDVFTPGTIDITTNFGTEFMQYCVSTTNYDGDHPPFGQSNGGNFTPTSSAAVTSQVKLFFKYVNGIINSTTS